MAQGGSKGARKALNEYWQRISRAAAFSPLQRSFFDRIAGRWTLDTSPAYLAMDIMSRLLSPYDLNPLGLNPLRKVLADSIDFESLSNSPIKLFITATKVRTGRGRIFRNGEITADVLLASACLPRARLIGTAVTPATPPSLRWFAKARRMIRSWCRSTRPNGRTSRVPPRRLSIG
jgi:predicted acylesterase/phospholipase RssA